MAQWFVGTFNSREVFNMISQGVSPERLVGELGRVLMGAGAQLGTLSDVVCDRFPPASLFVEMTGLTDHTMQGSFIFGFPPEKVDQVMAALKTLPCVGQTSWIDTRCPFGPPWR